MSSFVCTQECITGQKWWQSVYIRHWCYVCLCQLLFLKPDHMLDISMFCFLLDFKLNVFVFLSFSLSISPDDIGTCWYILLSGSVFIKESMFLPRSRYVPECHQIPNIHTSLQKKNPNTLSVNLSCILTLYLPSPFKNVIGTNECEAFWINKICKA